MRFVRSNVNAINKRLQAKVTPVTDFLDIYLALPKFQLTASQQDNVNS